MSFKRVRNVMIVHDEPGDDGRWHYPCLFCEKDLAFDENPTKAGFLVVAVCKECHDRKEREWEAG